VRWRREAPVGWHRIIALGLGSIAVELVWDAVIGALTVALYELVGHPIILWIGAALVVASVPLLVVNLVHKTHREWRRANEREETA
jgi:hypothetical protein